MKNLKYLDFGIQTLSLGAAAWFLIEAIGDTQAIGVIFLIQLILGIWQLLSSALTLTFSRNRFKRLHFDISVVYLVILFVLSIAQFHSGYLFGVFLIVPPWLLAIYYYVLTWLEVFPRYSRRSSFLPHINF
jgi:hypothetical protein